MSLVLCLETSSVNCSVALFRNHTLLAEKEEGGSYSHAENLHIFIQEILEKSEVKPTDLDIVAVGEGPGSFTGLRIGVAAAKGICYATGAKMVAVSSLKTMLEEVFNKVHEPSFYGPMVDARRMEVYTAIYNERGQRISDIRPEILDETSFQKELSERLVYFFGDGMPKWREVVTSENARFVDGILPSAKWMIKETLEKIGKNDFADVAYFEPLYLKDFQPTVPKKRV